MKLMGSRARLVGRKRERARSIRGWFCSGPRKMEDIGHGLGEGGEADGLGDVVGDFEFLTLLKVGGVIGRGHDNDGKMTENVLEAKEGGVFQTAPGGCVGVAEEGS